MNARGLAISSGVSGVGTSNNGGEKFLRSIATSESKMLVSFMILVDRKKKHSLMAGVCCRAIPCSDENYLQENGYKFPEVCNIIR